MHKPQLGFGLGLRSDHYKEILANPAKVDWFEILTENYLVPGGKPHYYLDQIREKYPLVMHGVAMSIGSSDSLNMDYLYALKKLADKVQPAWISDHLCWTGVNGKNMHDLLPLPYTKEVVKHAVQRIQQVQEFLGRQILIENVSSYLTYKESELTEWQFINEIVEQADCLILLDVNNVYVSSVNHQFKPLDFIKAMPSERIYQIHLAGHSNLNNVIIDTHDYSVADPVWQLYADTIRIHGTCSTMIERDNHIPPFQDLVIELDKARTLSRKILLEPAA